MRWRFYYSVFFSLFFFSDNLNAGIGITSQRLNKVYVISIGISADVGNNSSRKSSYINIPCPICLNDAKGLPGYLNDLKKKLHGQIDTVISYSYINTDTDIDELYNTFKKVQDKARAEDIFVFYYASASWGVRKNPETGIDEGYYLVSNRTHDSTTINRYSFTLNMLKALTDRIASQRQLIIFDTGSGQVIAPDYYKIFSAIIRHRLFLPGRTGSLYARKISVVKVLMKKE
jgi:hypothetical protein